jgi:hypothetical protein
VVQKYHTKEKGSLQSVLRIHKNNQAREYLVNRYLIHRIQLLAIKCSGHTEKMITPFYPPHIKKRRSKTRKFLGVKINGGRIKDQILEMLIISTVRNDLPRFNQIGKVKANQ